MRFKPASVPTSHFTDQRGSDAGGLTSEFYTKLWEAIAADGNKGSKKSSKASSLSELS